MAILHKIENFMGIRSAVLEDRKNISVIVGCNESGKTSLGGSISFAWSASALGFRGKDTISLIHRGASSFRVETQLGEKRVYRTRSTGTALKDVASDLNIGPDSLPLLFGENVLSGRPLRAFIDALASKQPSVEGDLSEEFKPFFKELVESGKVKSDLDLVPLAEARRASFKSPDKPAAPISSKPQQEALIQSKQSLDAARLALDEIQSATSLSVLRGDKKRIEDVLAHLAAVEKYNEAVAKMKEWSDPLAGRRSSLISLIQLKASLKLPDENIFKSAGFPLAAKAIAEAKAVIEEAMEGAIQLNATHVPPADLGKAPVLLDEAKAFYDSLSDKSIESLETLYSHVSSALSDLAQKTDAAKAAVTLAEENDQSLRSCESRWNDFETRMAEYEIKASEIAVHWNQWDQFVKFVSGLIQERRNKTISDFLATVSVFGGDLLANRELAIDDEGGVQLQGVPVNLLSLSTRWRVSLCVQASVARYANCPILVVDGADILDLKNRQALMAFLNTQILPHFEHTIILSTASGDIHSERQYPSESPMTKWIINEGSLMKCAA